MNTIETKLFCSSSSNFVDMLTIVRGWAPYFGIQRSKVMVMNGIIDKCMVFKNAALWNVWLLIYTMYVYQQRLPIKNLLQILMYWSLTCCKKLGNNTFCRTWVKFFYNAESNNDLKRNNVLPEIYLIICEIFQVKNGWFRTFCILKGHF